MLRVEWRLSSLDSFCPQLDPAELEMDNAEQFVAENITSIDWGNCQQWLSQYDCAADFGYPSNIKAYYGPGDVPEGGTETLHNIGALTTPVSETVTFTVGNELYPVTAVSTDAHVPTSSSESEENNNGDTLPARPAHRRETQLIRQPTRKLRRLTLPSPGRSSARCFWCS
ncbi:hypothetical protein BDW66DRAFT_81877 [Aspergillus desertorum]